MIGEEKSEVRYRLIPNLEAYRVGDDGSIWSSLQKPSSAGAHGRRWVAGGPWKRLVGNITNRGYRAICLQVDGRDKKLRVHRLVLLAFQGECPHGMQSAHNNGVRDDNRLCNLRWATPKENQADSKSHGTHAVGVSAPGAKLTGSLVVAIRRQKDSGASRRDLARKYGVCQTTIFNVCKRTAWAHIE